MHVGTFVSRSVNATALFRGAASHSEAALRYITRCRQQRPIIAVQPPHRQCAAHHLSTPSTDSVSSAGPPGSVVSRSHEIFSKCLSDYCDVCDVRFGCHVKWVRCNIMKKSVDFCCEIRCEIGLILQTHTLLDSNVKFAVFNWRVKWPRGFVTFITIKSQFYLWLIVFCWQLSLLTINRICLLLWSIHENYLRKFVALTLH